MIRVGDAAGRRSVSSGLPSLAAHQTGIAGLELRTQTETIGVLASSIRVGAQPEWFIWRPLAWSPRSVMQVLDALATNRPS